MESSFLSTLVLVVDLDGTLIRTDLSQEQLLLHLHSRPLRVLRVLRLAMQGPLALKHYLVHEVPLRVDTLPYRREVRRLIDQARKAGQTVILASASPLIWVQQVAEYLGGFDEVLGTTDLNLKGKNKLAAIRAQIATRPFAYAGDSRADLTIWRGCQHAILVNPSRSILRLVQETGVSLQIIGAPKPWTRSVLHQLRVHQWVKNTLVFVPLLSSHRVFQGAEALRSLLAWVGFSAYASAIYIINDALDLAVDRVHPTKKNRPLASGDLSLPQAACLLLVLVALALDLTWILGTGFAGVMATYVGANIYYNVQAKKNLVIDVVVLACLYTLRILAGGEAAGIRISHWLLSFSVFFFFGLALLKRFIELSTDGSSQIDLGRGYQARDRPMLMAAGLVSSHLAVLILTLYLNSETSFALYSEPLRLWLVTPLLLYWILRIWLLAGRGEVNHDPITFTIQDPVSWIVLSAMAGTFAWAL